MSKGEGEDGLEVVDLSFVLHPQVFAPPGSRPCPVYQELTLKESSAALAVIAFRNYYTAALRLSYLRANDDTGDDEVADDRWIDMDVVKLMADPHLETDAEAWIILVVAPRSADGEGADDSMSASPLTKVISCRLPDPQPAITRIRLYLIQPSPLWRRFGVNELAVLGRAVYGKAAADKDGVSASDADKDPRVARIEGHLARLRKLRDLLNPRVAILAGYDLALPDNYAAIDPR